MESAAQFKKGGPVVRSRATWAGFGGPKCRFRMRHPSKVAFWGAPRSKHSQLLKKETPFFRVRSKLSIIFSSEKHTFEAKCVTVVVVFGRDPVFSSEKHPRIQLLKDVSCENHTSDPPRGAPRGPWPLGWPISEYLVDLDPKMDIFN